jgi:hypothetical protein
MSDKATAETLRAEALAWRHEAHRVQMVLAQIFDHMHPNNGITDWKARYDAWEMAGKALNLPLPWTADQADKMREA